MDNVERKRLEVELMRVQAARGELEYKIMEREAEVKRILEHIAIQKAKEDELKEKLK